MKKMISTLCVFALAALALAACGRGPKPEQLLAGKWDGSVGVLEFQALEFVPDEKQPLEGKVNLSLLSGLVDGSYVITPAEKKDEPYRLKLTYTLAMLPTTRSYTFLVDDGTLTLQNEQTAVALTYHRAAPPAA